MSARAECCEGSCLCLADPSALGRLWLQEAGLDHTLLLLTRKRQPFLKTLYHHLLGNCHHKHKRTQSVHAHIQCLWCEWWPLGCVATLHCMACRLYLMSMALASLPLEGIVPATILLLRVTSLAWEGHLLFFAAEYEDTLCIWPSQSCPYISSELVLKMPGLSWEDKGHQLLLKPSGESSVSSINLKQESGTEDISFINVRKRLTITQNGMRF